MTSLPRSVPGPTTAVAPSRPASSTIASAIAGGAYEANASPSADVQRRDAVPCERRERRSHLIVTSGDGLHLAPPPKARARVSACSDGSSTSPVRVLEVDEDAHTTPICWSTSTTRGAPRRALAEDLGLLALALGDDEPELLEPRLPDARASGPRAASAAREAAPGPTGSAAG